MSEEIWVGETVDSILGASLGRQAIVVHSKENCAGTSCCIHNPSDHHMRSWKQLWRADRGLMERKCPHGVGHPDPDDLAYHARMGEAYLGVHGCDGCCMTHGVERV